MANSRNGGGNGAMRCSERVRDRLENEYEADAVEANGEDFRVAAWLLNITIVATEDHEY